MRVALLTAGDPNARTGGSLYHRHVADRAPALGVEIDVRPLPLEERSIAGADVVVVDSIAAAEIALEPPRVPIVASVQQRPGGLVGSRPRRALRRALDLRLYRRAAAVIVPSAYLADVLARAGVGRERIAVVEPGCLRADVAERVRRTGAPVSFLSVANLAPHKRPLESIEAFATMSDVDATLTMIGGCADERLARRVEARLRRADVAERVRWVGSRAPDHVRTAMLGADAFMSTALHESYAIALAEALAAGLPAVVSDSGNVPNLVRDGIDGFVVPPRDRRSFAAAMRRLATDADLRGRMATAAGARARAFPTWDETARRFVEVLDRVQPRRTSAA